MSATVNPTFKNIRNCNVWSVLPACWRSPWIPGSYQNIDASFLSYVPCETQHQPLLGLPESIKFLILASFLKPFQTTRNHRFGFLGNDPQNPERERENVPTKTVFVCCWTRWLFGPCVESPGRFNGFNGRTGPLNSAAADRTQRIQRKPPGPVESVEFGPPGSTDSTALTDSAGPGCFR